MPAPSVYDTAEKEDEIQQVIAATQQSRHRVVMALKRHENIPDAVFILQPHNWEDPLDDCHNHRFVKQAFPGDPDVSIYNSTVS